MPNRSVSLKQLIIARALEGLLVIVLIVLIVWVSGFLQNIRRDILAAQFSLETDLSGSVQKGLLTMELEKREHDVKRIFENVPQRDKIADVIGQIEASGKTRNVKVFVPLVEEKGEVENSTAEVNVDPTKFVEVIMTVSATGTASDVLQFFHELEHLPFLVGVQSFSIQRGTESLPRGVTATIPGDLPPGEDESVEAIPSTQLNAKLLLYTLPPEIQAIDY